MLSVEPSGGRDWNHELAVVHCLKREVDQGIYRMHVGLESSIGRNYEIGIIRWPRRHRKQFRLQLTVACTFIRAARAAVVTNFQRQSQQASDFTAVRRGSTLVDPGHCHQALGVNGWQSKPLLHGQEPSGGRALLEASPGQNGHRMGGVTHANEPHRISRLSR
jgi:hypothetical protein